MAAYHVRDLARKMQASAPGSYYLEVGFEKQDDPVRRFSLYRRKHGSFTAAMDVQAMPGCCGVAVFSRFEGKRPADVVQLVQIGVAAARKAGHGAVVLTLRSESDIVPMLRAGGFHDWEFLNGKTNNHVTFLYVDLGQSYKTKVKDHTAGE